jgi:hypothetical protein
VKALLFVAALLAYIPSTGSLLRKAAARTGSLGRVKEVTLLGTLTVKDEPARNAQLVLRFPLSCRLEAEGGASLSVKGTASQPAAGAEGTTGPALQLLQLACPFITYRGLSANEAEGALRIAAQAQGADLTAGTALSRLADRVVYVLGATAHDTARPQLWLYKDNHAPARLIAQGGGDLRLLQYGNPASAEWFPRVIELWTDGQLAARFETLETKGARGAGQEEEDDSQ